MIDPMDRSMPPVIITKTMPTPAMQATEDCWSRFTMFAWLTNVGFRTPNTPMSRANTMYSP